MKGIQKLVLAATAALSVVSATPASAATDLALFSADRTPIGSIGFYSSGCLDSATRLEGGEKGLLKLFVERKRWFGNPTMIELLTELGVAYHQQWRVDVRQIGGKGAPSPVLVERIQIGDISQEGGGRITRHASHQIGLDVDIAYMRRNHRETDPERGFDASFDELFVKNGKVTANLDDVRQWWVWRWLVSTGKVERIFVDPRIKKFFCEQAEGLEPDDETVRTAVLHVLRPYPDHQDHFHMRIACPDDDARCVRQEPVAAGSGCSDRELGGNGGDEMSAKKPPATPPSGDLSSEDILALPARTAHPLPAECSDHGSFPHG